MDAEFGFIIFDLPGSTRKQKLCNNMKKIFLILQNTHELSDFLYS